MSTSDPIAVIETAYQLESEGESTWLARLAHAVRRDLGTSQDAFLAWTYSVDKNGWIQLGAVAQDGIGRSADGVLKIDLDPAEQSLLAQFHLRAGIGYVRSSLGAAPDGVLTAYCDRSFGALGVADMLALTAVDPTRHGCIIGLLKSSSATLNPQVRSRWQRLGAHIRAAHRLRTRLAQVELTSARLEHAEAILGPSGALNHAADPAKSVVARDALRAGVRAMDRARGPLRKQNALEAMDAWRGLVAGRWSLVDHFDSDGRRYIVAHRNDPEVADPRGLTERERQIVGYADLGRSNKEIAYELGISQTTVAVHLARARLKLAALRQS
jgi:DNA-binding CsgD family transcriptional regulator